MRKKLGLFVWLVWLLSNAFKLQAATWPDSTRISNKARFVFNFDTRYTLFDQESVRVLGLKSGIEWDNKFRAGLGYYFLRNPIDIRSVAMTAVQPDSKTWLTFYYGAVYGEYVLLKNHKWELSLPVQGGFGNLKTENRSVHGQLLASEKVAMFLLEPSVAGHYKVFHWVGLGAGLGYRQMLSPQPANVHLNAPIYYIKVKLFAGELFRQMRGRYCPKMQ